MNPLRSLTFIFLTFLSYSSLGREDSYEKPTLTLVYGVPHYPPNSIISDNSFSGLDVDLINHLAQQLNIRIKFSACSWVRCLELAKKGQVDLLSSVAFTKERNRFLHFIHPPYSAGHVVFLVRKGEEGSIRTFEDLSGKIIGKESGSMPADRFNNAPDLRFYETSEVDTLLVMLVSERIDAIMGTSDEIALLAEQSDLKEEFGQAEFIVSVPSGHLAISKRTFDAEHTVKLFERQLQIMLTSGMLQHFTR